MKREWLAKVQNVEKVPEFRPTKPLAGKRGLDEMKKVDVIDLTGSDDEDLIDFADESNSPSKRRKTTISSSRPVVRVKK
jgi:hypothetical protein